MSEIPYNEIAAEYYDDFHKTCRNFDVVTRVAISTRQGIPSNGLVLDVGAGRGRCTEYLGISSERIIQLDNSESMLVLQPREACLLRLKHGAENLPFLSNAFSVVCAFLSDPYFGLNFLSEAYRVLEERGTLIATLPAFEWGCALRKKQGASITEARFKKFSGETVFLPSNIFRVDQIVDMLSHIGFKSDIKITKHSLPKGHSPISQDVTKAAESEACEAYSLPLIYLITATKG